jgi:hypothetical protein
MSTARIIQNVTRATVGVLAAAAFIGLASPASAAPATAGQTAADNSQAANRVARESTPQDGKVTAVFELTGTGTADAVAIDPADYLNYKALPFRKTVRVPADIDLLQIHESGTHSSDVGCRITLDGEVVVDHPHNSDCVYIKQAD